MFIFRWSNDQKILSDLTMPPAHSVCSKQLMDSFPS